MNRYKYDTHVHTSEVSSCGKVPAKEMVKLYKEAAYDGIVITDHFYEAHFDRMDLKTWNEKVDRFLMGYRQAAEQGEKMGLQVLLGIELRFPGGSEDFLVYGVDEAFLKEHEAFYLLGLKGFFELIQGKDILIYQAHPFRPGLRVAQPEYLHGVEVINGNPRHDSRDDLAYAFAKEHDLLMIAGSDAHQIEDIGGSGIYLPSLMSDSQQLVKWIREVKTPDFIR